MAEGWAIILPLLAAAVAVRRRPRLRLAALGAALAVGAALRDPERVVLATDQALSPADGRVVAIDTVTDDYFGVEMVEVAIFLALWHVHVQRAPLAGRIVGSRTVLGGYGPAYFASAAENYRQTLYLETDWGPCALSQIAGLLARRIVQWVEPGDEVALGQRIGMIKFGSRVTVRLPLGSEILVQPGQEVRAGRTPIARRAG